MPSLVLIKPDAVKANILGWCLSHFDQFGIVNIGFGEIGRGHCRQHYAEHVEKDFYPALEDFMVSGPLAAVQLNGDCSLVRQVAMEIRNELNHSIVGPRNIVHASDSEEAAKREINIWFAESFRF